MQLQPRYGTEPIIVLEGDPAAIATPAIRQRQRLVDVLAGFDDQQWQHPSRCDGWTNRDVIVHLGSTNTFWSYSIGAGLAGEPTRFLATFDPVATPAQLVAADADRSPGEVLEAFATSTAALVDRWAALDAQGWQATAEAPPGHLSVSAVAHHALWDSWVHERDILEPLGLAQVIEADEVAASLRYAAALAPGFAISLDRAETGTLRVEGEPDVRIEVAITPRSATVRDLGPTEAAGAADLVLTGDAVELLETLSLRRGQPAAAPDDVAWMVQGLATVFDG